MRVDDEPPTVTLQSPTVDRPAEIPVTSEDNASGLATREVLLRRRGSTAWISLPIPCGRRVRRRVEDEDFADGVYELRARAVDVAGNERQPIGARRGLAEIALPLRLRTTLRVGRPTRVKARGARGRYRVKLVERPKARYGKTIPLRGRLSSPGGNPLAHRDIQVFEQTRLPASPWRLIATITTSRTGRFTFKALRGPSRTLRFRFGGSETIRGGTADVRLAVRAVTSLHVNRPSVVNGEDVRFRGRLQGRGIPASGKLIELQAFARGRWLTLANNARERTHRPVVVLLPILGNARQRALSVPRAHSCGCRLSLRDRSFAPGRGQGEGVVISSRPQLPATREYLASERAIGE